MAGIVTASNDGTASNTSDGEANITTGKAAAAGNRSQTALTQNANGEIDGLGIVLNTQTRVVANVGLGVANSGNNTAVGNVSDQRQRPRPGGRDRLGQRRRPHGTHGDRLRHGRQRRLAENASDGTADIRTGAAQADGQRVRHAPHAGRRPAMRRAWS